MNENIISKALLFIQKCDSDFEKNLFLPENSSQAKEYLKLLKKIKKDNNSAILKATLSKLDFIIKQIDAVNYHTYSKESILNLVSLSVTDYIISLIKNKHLIDRLLISRYAYIELSKALYYDISYVKQMDQEAKKRICNAPVNVKKEKIFSYVTCNQWLELYKYILEQFGIEVIKRSREGQDHVWGEIKLDDEQIIIADATDYINSSIDLSNAKSNSPTVGFIVLPKEYANIRLYDVFTNSNNLELARNIMDCYQLNRELDRDLGYIKKKGYPVEQIIEENELFHYAANIITNSTDLKRYSQATLDFFRTLKIPNNIDGYEIYAYYYMFIRKLPLNIKGNISQQTMYVDAFSYNHRNTRKKFLHAPREYLRYLEDLIYSRYYKYLSDEENNSFLEHMKMGDLGEKQVLDMIVKNEMIIAEINRSLNLYYAINNLQIYEPMTANTLGIQLYEPMMGTKIFSTQEEFDDFKKTLLLK